MIRYYTKENGRLIELNEPRPGCWINATYPFEQGQLESLASNLQVPLDFLTDSLDIDERSRYEREDEGRLILVNTPILNEIDKDSEAIYITSPIGIILSDDHVTTITGVENPIIQKFLENRVRYFGSHLRFVAISNHSHSQTKRLTWYFPTWRCNGVTISAWYLPNSGAY